MFFNSNRKIMVILFLFYTHALFGKTVFDSASKKYGIDRSILVTIAKQESDFNDDVIGVVIPSNKVCSVIERCFDVIGCKYAINKSCTRVSVYPKKEVDRRLVYKTLDKLGVDFDVGLMQINRANIKRLKLDRHRLLTDIEYNIENGAMLFDSCNKMFPNKLAYAFECYNKGTNSSRFNYSYSNQIVQKYKNLFYVKN